MSKLEFLLAGPTPFSPKEFEDLRREFQLAVSNLSSGRLIIEYPERSGAFSSTRDLVATVQKGAVAGGIAPLRAVLRERPEGEEMAYDQVPGLALGHAATISLDRIFRRVSRDYVQSDLEILMTIPGDSRGLFTRQPIKTLNDLKGIKFATFDRRTHDFAKAFDADIVSTDGRGFNTAIRESADAFLARAGFIPPRRNDRVHFQHFYPLHAYVPIFVVFINRQLFNDRLTNDQREVLYVAAGLFERLAWKDQVRRERMALDALVKNGIEVAAMTAEIRRDLKGLGQTLVRQSAKSLARLLDGVGYKDYPAVACQAVTIFFATNRKRTDTGDPADARFGFEPDPKATYGRVEVGLPYREPDRTLPKELQCDHGPVEDITVLHRMVLGEGEFLKQVKSTASGDRILKTILIHGYGNDFDDAAMLAGEFVYDMDRKARLGFMFTWPSAGSPSPVAYLEDEKRVGSASSHLAEFVKKLSSAVGGEVDLVAHSMGSRALVAAINELYMQRAAPVKNQLGFVAADIDEKSFTAIEKAIADDIVSRTLTLYSSDNDLALRLSKLIHPFQGRVGLIIDKPFSLPPFEVVDISRENSSFLGHSYLRIEPLIRQDVGKAILYRENASGRGLYPHPRKGVKVYTFRR